MMKKIICIDPDDPSYMKNQIKYHADQIRLLITESNPNITMISIHRMGINYWREELNQTTKVIK